MRRVVGHERLPARRDRVVPRGGERGVQRERVPADGLAQRAGPAQSPVRRAEQAPRESFHHTRVEEVEHSRCNT